MNYTAKDYSRLLGMKGFSDALLKNHFTLYQGYVGNTNKLMDILDRMVKTGTTGTPEFAEMKRRFGWEFNGMRLHEHYFDNLGGSHEIDRAGLFTKTVIEQFGSFENWEKEFRATGEMRGIGWAVLYFDNLSGMLINCWINEHDTGHPAGCDPILIMDVFEHAYMLDYGLKRVDYIDAFFSAINWSSVEPRFRTAKSRMIERVSVPV